MQHRPTSSTIVQHRPSNVHRPSSIRILDDYDGGDGGGGDDGGGAAGDRRIFSILLLFAYRYDKMTLGICAEQVLEVRITGLNTRAGDVMTVMFKYGTRKSSQLAVLMQNFSQSDHILQILDIGVSGVDYNNIYLLLIY